MNIAYSILMENSKKPSRPWQDVVIDNGDNTFSYKDNPHVRYLKLKMTRPNTNGPKDPSDADFYYDKNHGLPKSLKTKVINYIKEHPKTTIAAALVAVGGAAYAAKKIYDKKKAKEAEKNNEVKKESVYLNNDYTMEELDEICMIGDAIEESFLNEGFLNLFKKKNKEGAKKLEPSEKDIEEAINWLKNPTTLDNYNLTKNVSCLTKAAKVDIQTIYSKISHSRNLDKENISDILLNGGDGDRKIKIEDLEDEASKEVFTKYITLVPNQFADIVCEDGENIYFTSKGKIHCMSTDGITEYSIKDFEDIFGGFYN
jgi:hypothetical protein